MPLPPYIEALRPADERDREDYQTVWARREGAVAAPTASLHFDEPLLEALRLRGVAFTHVTLHVGAGTFLPVKADDISEHRMHAEWGELTEAAAAEIADTRSAGGRIIPVGTTALRLLESAARDGAVRPWRGETDIFITPGFPFRASDALLTNFHLPRSTLMMLVSAFLGPDRIREAYAHAIRQGYRFFSYGDASLCCPGGAERGRWRTPASPPGGRPGADVLGTPGTVGSGHASGSGQRLGAASRHVSPDDRNGLQGTLLGLRGHIEAFSTLEISVVMSAYFLGFLFASASRPG
jgi:S-adenosylmethionine:tRNA ribosyltransferase-isomerase